MSMHAIYLFTLIIKGGMLEDKFELVLQGTSSGLESKHTYIPQIFKPLSVI